MDEDSTGRVPLRTLLPRLGQRSVAEFLDDHCPQLAAAVAYHVLFSLFPLAIVLAGVFGIVVHTTGVQADVVDAIVANVPLSGEGTARLRRLLTRSTNGLPALGLVGVVGLVYAASGMMAAIRLALNQAWDVVEYRPFLRGKLIDLALVFGTALVAAATLALTVGVRLAGELAGGWATVLLGVVVPLAVGFGVALFLYRTIPAVDVSLAAAWPGALLAAAGFVLLQNLFALYVDHFADYDAIYGSLGAVIAFMFFVYVSSLAFLLGAEVASEWPRVREHVRHGAVEDGPPLATQVKELLKRLWVRPAVAAPRSPARGRRYRDR